MATKGKSAKFYAKNKASRDKKKKYDTAYNKKTVKERVDRNRKRREQQKKGNPKAKVGSTYDFDHATGKMEPRSKNRGRTSKQGGTAGDKRARG